MRVSGACAGARLLVYRTEGRRFRIHGRAIERWRNAGIAPASYTTSRDLTRARRSLCFMVAAERAADGRSGSSTSPADGGTVCSSRCARGVRQRQPHLGSSRSGRDADRHRRCPRRAWTSQSTGRSGHSRALRSSAFPTVNPGAVDARGRDLSATPASCPVARASSSPSHRRPGTLLATGGRRPPSGELE